ncbi:MAG: chemotaxis protein CheX [Gammaproteobacteria bacterium]|nr:chemotaxis protein CheX [Gammaproteobacteria bacterium]NND60315.1 chemotaxis protein CheX [Gammaproteobacteria bacterium]
MDELDLQVFIDGTTDFFAQMGGEKADVGTPYLVSNCNSEIKGFTGIIGVSGKRRGSVYFTAPPVLLKVLLMSIGEEDTSHENLCDMVGEVANVISGSARKEFGQDFLISVPVVVVGRLDKIVVPAELRSFVVPISWKSYDAALVISLE